MMNDTSGSDLLQSAAHQAMKDRGLEPDFPPAAIRQLANINHPAQESNKLIRDLRNLLWCSIDNDSSKDLDQLSVAQPLSDGSVKIYVAIADVDALVKRDTPIDQHAQANTTSVYTVAQIFSMLPERLSTDLTSLNENEDRLAIVVEMTVTSDGIVQSSDIYRAVVNNHAKLAYRSVAAWLDGKEPMPERVAKVPGMEEQIRIQDRVSHAMRSVRYLHGSLELESTEAEAIVSEGKISELRVDAKNRAKEMIEDFMIAANGETARFLEKKGRATLQRIVRSPERWDRIQSVAREYGEQLPNFPDSKALAEFLSRRRQADPIRFPDLSLTIVKLIGAGEYVVQKPGANEPGHFGLAVRQYSHSTAPNRRYPDLITQRMLKAAMAKQTSPYSASDLEYLAKHCTEKEDAAKKVERQIRKSAAALFLGNRIGETFNAIVTGISDKGTWVRVLTPPVEGRLMENHSRIDVGDQITVRLAGVNVQKGFIDFVRTNN